MTALNELVIVLSAPLLIVFVLMTAHVRRFGAFHWAIAYLASWTAGFVDELDPVLQPLVVWLGTLATLLFATGANAYGGGRLGFRQWVQVLLLPFGLGLLASTAGPALGYAGVAVSDFVLLAFAAWRTWPRGDLRALATARALPFAFVLFIPATVYYQISASLGQPRDWPTVVIATGMISLAAVQLLALTARTVRDQTLIRQRLEERLASQEDELEASRARARSAERLAAVGTLAAGIAHQINNAIGAILAAAQFELTDETDPDAKSPSHRSTLETIEREALRCGRIVRNVLLFARTDPGQVADHDLNGIVEASWHATADHARRRDARVELVLSPSPVQVRGNAIELEQVVVNLIRNAVESRSSGAAVEVRVDAIAGRACVAVRDDGAGLCAEARRRLFEPFYTTKLREGGSGLGLSVAHGILRTHGGEIEVDSEVGVGATFRVFLPLRVAAR